LLVGSLFFGCVAFKLNGSSIGAWQKVLKEQAPVRGLVLSTPKSIRMDEWIVWTPSTLSQARQTPPYPIENSNLGYGRAPLLMSVPVAYYTTFFRPQLWGFFLFDLERGFSFYWCSKVFGLLLAWMWLLRQLRIRSRGIIAFGAVWIFFSSYVQWWFSTNPMLPEMVASWAVCIGCVIVFGQETNRWKLAVAGLGFFVCGINFILCLYPPFQIPLSFLGLALLGALSMERRKSDRPFRMGRALLFVAALGAAILLTLVPFWIDAGPTMTMLAHTEYPGRRHNTGGNWSVWKLFGGLIGFFESEGRVPPDFPNICEASNFYPLWLFALLGLAAGRVRSRISISPLMVMLTVFLVVLNVYCVVRLPEWLLQATLLAHVHEDRALLGIGLANIILVCLFLERYRGPVFGKSWAWGGAVATTVVLIALFYGINTSNPAFFATPPYFALLLFINALLVMMFFWDRARRLLPPVFALLLICSNGLINPIMRGLGPLIESEAFQEIDKLRAADPKAKWIAYGDYMTAQLIKATGATVLNGTKWVPDLPLLRQLDPKGAYETIYNRYAWIICAPKVFPEEVSFTLLQPDFYTIYLPPSLPLLHEQNYRYYVFRTVWRDASLYDFSLVASPSNNLFIYRRSEGP
jgi:hypothetical protein